jgi:pyruvate/2-oxoglutarate/acetoin dehydrogenase E1 component
MRYVESLNQALHQLLKEDERVFVLGEDILDPYGGAFKVTKGLSSVYPDRVLTTPISEASITGFATGMALRGFRPILEIMFGDFITLCADQIINNATKFFWMYNGQVKVPMVIRTPMGGRRGYGPTHSQTLETIFMGVPGLTIISPSHFHNPGELLYKAVRGAEGPVLFIENKTLYPQHLCVRDFSRRVGDFFAGILVTHSESFPSIGLTLTKEDRPELTLIVYGGMASLAVEAVSNIFMRDEISVEIIIPSLIKPFPLSDVLPSIKKSRRVLIVEEGIRTSGWGAELGSQIYETVFDDLLKPIKRLGAEEISIPSSRPLEDQVLPQVADIEEAIYQQVRG